MSYDVIHRSKRTRGIFAQGDSEAAYDAIVQGSFERVILCAVELEEMFTLVLVNRPNDRERVIFASNEDGLTLSRKQIRIAARAAKQAAAAYKRGERVLITCAAGRNRSGLVTALALHFVSGCSGQDACIRVRARRQALSGPALSNPVFEKFLSAIPERKTDGRVYLSKVG